MTNDLVQFDDMMAELGALTGDVAKDARSLGRAMPPTVSISGNRFYLIENGDRRPAPDPINLYFMVASAKLPQSRVYYDGKYDPKAEFRSPPACYSIDGVTPEADSPTAQSDNCRACKRSEWGSKVLEGGALSTACSTHKQLCIKIIGVPGLWLFNIPPASIRKQWDVYAAGVEQMSKEKPGTTLGNIITRCTFQEGSQGILEFASAAYASKAVESGKLTVAEVQDFMQAIKRGDPQKVLWGSAEREEQYKSGRITAPVLPKPEEFKRIDPPKATYVSGKDSLEAAFGPAIKPVIESAPFVDDGMDAFGPVVKKEEPKRSRKRETKAAVPPIVTSVEHDAKSRDVLASLGLDDVD